MSVPRFYLPTAGHRAPAVTVPPDEAHHLRHVLRLKAGADVRAFDGAGREWAGTVAAVTRREVTIAIDREVAPVPEPPVRVTLVVGWLKGDQMDVVVRDATMLGAAEIVPLVSARVTVPKAATRAGASLERWRRVAIASARQCGRAVVPVIGPARAFDAALASGGGAALVVCAEPSASATGPAPARPRPSAAHVLIGPEGGWTPAEIAAAAQAGATFLGLGPRTLRAETAPVVALTALWNLWGW